MGNVCRWDFPFLLSLRCGDNAAMAALLITQVRERFGY